MKELGLYIWDMPMDGFIQMLLMIGVVYMIFKELEHSWNVRKTIRDQKKFKKSVDVWR